MTDQLPPENAEAEVSVLGAVMLAEQALAVVTAEHRLRPEHFYRPRHQRIWAAILQVAAAGGPVDPLTVCEHMRQHGELEEAGGQHYVYSLGSLVPSAGNARAYAAIVHDKAVWRARLTASRAMADAALLEDPDAYAQAEAKLVHSDDARSRTSMPDDLAEHVYQLLEGDPPETFPWPFARLNKLTMGGMRRGHVTLVSGPTSHGKSIVVDQTLVHIGQQPGLRSHLYFNEDTEEERVQRLVARMARVPIENIATRHLTSDHRTRIGRALNRIPFGMTDCTGWTAEDVVRDMVHKRWDVVGVDTLGQFPGARRRDALEEISRLFNQAVKPARANCHMLLAHHLNRSRSGQGAVIPFPVLADIRESGQLANDVANVLFVWRDQDEETGEPLASGLVRFAKARNGRPGGLPVTFEKEFQRFEPQEFSAIRAQQEAMPV